MKKSTWVWVGVILVVVIVVAVVLLLNRDSADVGTTIEGTEITEAPAELAATDEPEPTASPEPEATEEPEPTASPVPDPTATPEPTATATPKTTAAPTAVVTAAPTAAAKAAETAQPKVAAAAAQVTAAPAGTSAAKPTTEPAEKATVVPAATVKAAATAVPESTSAPATKQPVVAAAAAQATIAPAATEAVEATEAPEATEEVEATEAPEATEEVEATEAPEATEAVEATEAPEATEAVEATEASATGTPVVEDTEEPVITPDPHEGNDELVYEAAYAYLENLPSDDNVISAADLFAKMDADEEMLILDIRSAEHYADGHLKGAVNLSFFDMSIPEALNSLPDDRLIMVYCYTGQTASQTTALLNIAGRTAKNVQSGFDSAITQQEGYDAYLSTEPAELPSSAGFADVHDAISGAITEYFVAKNDLGGTDRANFNIAADTVKAMLDDESIADFTLLSVRQAADYAKAHIPGAINIPFGQGMEEELAKLPADKAVIVYGDNGQTSSQTMAVLRMMGYEAYNLSGGMGDAETGTGWLGLDYPVEAGEETEAEAETDVAPEETVTAAPEETAAPEKTAAAK